MVSHHNHNIPHLTTDEALPNPSSVMVRLRAETRTEHKALESLTISHAMVEEHVTLEAYTGLLLGYAMIHRTLDQVLSETRLPGVCHVWEEGMKKSAWLRGDLRFLGVGREEYTLFPSYMPAKRMARWIESLTGSICLLGILYVTEGSTLGGGILSKHVARCFNWPDGQGLRYLSSYGQHTGSHWKAFCARMEEAVLCPQEQDLVIEAARQAFLMIGQVLQSLG